LEERVRGRDERIVGLALIIGEPSGTVNANTHPIRRLANP
jgi:hypothetical protein